MLKLAHRDNNKIAVLFIDLNDFKIVNDRFGHKAGDEILIHVGHTLRKFIRQSDIAVRLGGDEFAILLSNIINREDIIRSLGQIQQETSRPVINQDLVVNGNEDQEIFELLIQYLDYGERDELGFNPMMRLLHGKHIDVSTYLSENQEEPEFIELP
jgi:GGDEF domain-containing protein